MSTGQSMTVRGDRTEKGQHTKEIYTIHCPPYPGPPHHVPSAEGKSLKSEGGSISALISNIKSQCTGEKINAVNITDQEVANDTAAMPL